MTTKVTIDMSQLPVNWQAGETYRISLDGNFVKEVDGNRSPSPLVPTLYSLTPISQTFLSSAPANNSTQVNATSVVLNYSKIYPNSGSYNFYLYKVGAPDKLITTISTSDSSKYSFSNNSITLNLLGYIDGASTYYILCDAAIFKDIYDINTQAITSSSDIRYSTKKGPSITSITPGNLTTGTIETDRVTLTFDRTRVYAGTGNWYVYEINNTLVDTIPISDSRITVSNVSNTVLLNLSSSFERNTTYYLKSDYGTLRDNIYFNYDGAIDDSIWKYTTANSGPNVSSVTPTNGTTGSYTTTYSISFDRSIIATNKDRYFRLYKDGVEIQTFKPIVATSGTSFISGNSVTFNLKNIIDGESVYHMRADKTAIKPSTGAFGNNPIIDDTVFKVTTGLKPYVASTNFSIYNNTDPVHLFSFNRSVENYGDSRLHVIKFDNNQEIATNISQSDPRLVKINTNSYRLNLKDFALEKNTRYYISSNNNWIRSTSDGFNAIPSTATNMSFTATAAQISSLNFTYNGVINNPTLTLSYDRNISALSTGSVQVFLGTSEPGTLVTSFNTSSGRLSTSTNQLSLNIFGLLKENNTYWLKMDDGVFYDTVPFTNDAITNSSQLKFKTPAFNVISTVPSYGATSVLSGSCKLTYNKVGSVKTGTNYYLYSGTNLISTFPTPVSSTTTSTLSFNLAGLLDKQTTYHVTSDLGNLIDNLGIDSRKIDDDTVCKFTTDSGPILESKNTVLVEWVETSINLHPLYPASSTETTNYLFESLKYDRIISAGTSTAKYYLYKSDNSIVSEITKTISANTTTAVVRLPSLESRRDYYILGDEGVVKDEILLTSEPLSNTNHRKISTRAYVSRAVTENGLNSDHWGRGAVSVFGSLVFYANDYQIRYFDIENKNNRGEYNYNLMNKLSVQSDAIIMSSESSTTNIKIISNNNLFPYSTVISERGYISDKSIGEISLAPTAKTLISYISTSSSTPVLVWDNRIIANTPYEIYNSDHHTDCEFGYSAKMDDSIIVIGSPRQNNSTTPDTGRVYVYNSSRTLLFTIENPNSQTGDRFGHSVAINDSYIAVGAPTSSLSNEGKVYIFNRSNGALIRTFTLSSPSRLGLTVSFMSNNRIAISDYFSNFIFRISDGILASDSYPYSLLPGFNMAAAGNYIAAGLDTANFDNGKMWAWKLITT
jgi:hypothetical protein